MNHPKETPPKSSPTPLSRQNIFINAVTVFRQKRGIKPIRDRPCSPWRTVFHPELADFSICQQIVGSDWVVVEQRNCMTPEDPGLVATKLDCIIGVGVGFACEKERDIRIPSDGDLAGRWRKGVSALHPYTYPERLKHTEDAALESCNREPRGVGGDASPEAPLRTSVFWGASSWDGYAEESHLLAPQIDAAAAWGEGALGGGSQGMDALSRKRWKQRAKEQQTAVGPIAPLMYLERLAQSAAVTESGISSTAAFRM
ncbi:hypothetical protein M407DRAFT_10497 [Tulasnella calospora MUT 4182]|uniref:Uncharacterized protein n=1 Tax=Tulasnella calospora MUT 4182 TaxID=1051891 RepID=A0A0C3QAL3_9AGAM|nr:hypothetical protein M407DRAFT_10497 [Tulasnella calospora MUT 4182]